MSGRGKKTNMGVGLEQDGFLLLLIFASLCSDVVFDLWLTDIAPSGELRKFFAHAHERCEQFREKYYQELSGKKDLIDLII